MKCKASLIALFLPLSVFAEGGGWGKPSYWQMPNKRAALRPDPIDPIPRTPEPTPAPAPPNPAPKEAKPAAAATHSRYAFDDGNSIEQTPMGRPPTAASRISKLVKLEGYFDGFEMCRYKEKERVNECLPSRDSDVPFVLKERYPENKDEVRDPLYEMSYGKGPVTVDTLGLLPHRFPIDKFHTEGARLYGDKNEDTGRVTPKILLVEIRGTVGTGGKRYIDVPDSRFENDTYCATLVVKISDDGICITGGIREDVPAARAAELIHSGVVPRSRTGYVDSYRAQIVAEPKVRARLGMLLANAEKTDCKNVDQDTIRHDLLRSPL